MDRSYSAAVISASLTTQRLGRTIHLFDRVDSTNSIAARLGQEGAPHGTVVSADDQTSGRGRRGRPWHTVPGQSLCVSILLRPDCPAGTDRSWLAWIPLAAALGVAEGIASSISRSPQLKWPNDLLFGSKKVGGLLCESLGTSGQAPLLVVGIGINVNLAAQDFPDDLRTTATSLTLECGRSVDRGPLLAAILNRLEPRLDAICRSELDSIRQDYRRACATLGRRVRVELQERVPLEGMASDIADSGALLIVPDAPTATSPTPRVVEVLAGDVVHLR